MPQTHAETPAEFLKSREGVEAAVMRIGLHTTQVILVAADGEWLRYVVPSLEAAKVVCERLGLEFQEGVPEHLTRRMAGYKRSAKDWAAAPYPEKQRGTSV